MRCFLAAVHNPVIGSAAKCTTTLGTPAAIRASRDSFPLGSQKNSFSVRGACRTNAPTCCKLRDSALPIRPVAPVTRTSGTCGVSSTPLVIRESRAVPHNADSISHVKELFHQHHSEMARAAAAAMQQNYQEAIDICSELLTSGLYEQVAQSGQAEDARAFRAEARLLMATAMHYADAAYEDIVRLLSFAMDAPPS